jgi:hypothetical protein
MGIALFQRHLGGMEIIGDSDPMISLGSDHMKVPYRRLLRSL